jgi:D-alanyl-D-alanine carboxypeptidase
MKTLLAALGATLLLAAPAHASIKTDADKLVDTGVTGTIVYARDGAHTTRVAAGYGDAQTRTPMRPTDRWRVGSVTKAFTATVVLQLAGEGRLSLDDTVEQHLPGLVPGGDQITIRELLNMSSGLADYLTEDMTVRDSVDTGRRFTPRDLVGFGLAHPVHFTPGQGWFYSNTGYALAGMIVEQVTGESFTSELRRRVLVPAGLRHTSFPSGPKIAGPHAHGYLNGTDVSELNQTWSWTAGALVSTGDDVARFYRALLGGRLLRPAQLADMKTLNPVNGPFGPGTVTGYGLGIFRLELPCGQTWGHEGGSPGYKTFTLHSRDAKRQVVVMVNQDEEHLTPRQEKAFNRLITTAYCAR